VFSATESQVENDICFMGLQKFAQNSKRLARTLLRKFHFWTYLTASKKFIVDGFKSHATKHMQSNSRVMTRSDGSMA
jgi:hypothetical protein